MKFFFAQDPVEHWYMVQVDKRAEWNALINSAEPWDVPTDWAHLLAGHPSEIEFEFRRDETTEQFFAINPNVRIEPR